MGLLPKPQKLKKHEGQFILSYDTRILMDNKWGPELLEHAALIKKEADRSLGIPLALSRGNCPEEENTILLTRYSKPIPQFYTLTVSQKGIRIEGGDRDGLLYGIQTLRQLMALYGAVLPCMDIEDYPAIPNRGFYHDITRGRIPTLQTLKALADRLSYYKINQLQLYVENSYLFKGFSEVVRDDTPLTAEEILELDQYCGRLSIELVPSLSSFGHLYKVLRTRSFSHLCELEDPLSAPHSMFDRMQHHTLDVSNPDSFQLVKNMIREFIPLFSSKQFNICADETFDLGKGKSKPLADKNGVDALYLDFLKKLLELIREEGLKPMFWGDIILNRPEALKELPSESVCLNWGYSPTEREDNAKTVHDTGATQYLCPGVWGWKSLMNRLDHAYGNISAMCAYGAKYRCEGILNTNWGDYGNVNLLTTAVPGIIYGAAMSWNSDLPAFDDLNQSLSRLEYGDRSGTLADLFNRIGQQQVFTWELAVRYVESRDLKREDREVEAFFSSLNPEDLLKANEKLLRQKEELAGKILDIKASWRKDLHGYFVMMKAMALFNTIARVIYETRYKKDIKADREEGFALAEALELWAQDYKRLWYTDSKPGELYRIEEILFRYADLLREGTL